MCSCFFIKALALSFRGIVLLLHNYISCKDDKICGTENKQWVGCTQEVKRFTQLLTVVQFNFKKVSNGCGTL
jgi:hypothetical protein